MIYYFDGLKINKNFVFFGLYFIIIKIKYFLLKRKVFYL